MVSSTVSTKRWKREHKGLYHTMAFQQRCLSLTQRVKEGERDRDRERLPTEVSKVSTLVPGKELQSQIPARLLEGTCKSDFVISYKWSSTSIKALCKPGTSQSLDEFSSCSMIIGWPCIVNVLPSKPPFPLSIFWVCPFLLRSSAMPAFRNNHENELYSTDVNRGEPCCFKNNASYSCNILEFWNYCFPTDILMLYHFIHEDEVKLCVQIHMANELQIWNSSTSLSDSKVYFPTYKPPWFVAWEKRTPASTTPGLKPPTACRQQKRFPSVTHTELFLYLKEHFSLFQHSWWIKLLN